MIAILCLALQSLRFRKREVATGAADVERQPWVRDHLLQKQADGTESFMATV